MTLRRTLLTAFVLLGLVPAVALSWLSFSRTREAMTAQIRASVSVQARSLASAIDALLFERVQNALVWRRSELMQDLRLGDVDKRVSHFLAGLQAGYAGVYRSLDAVDADGVVVASSVPAHIGRPLPAPGPLAFDTRLSLPDGRARLWLPAGDRLDGRQALTVETRLPAEFDAPGGRGFRLVLALAPGSLDALLDAAAGGPRRVVVIDRAGHWLAGSSGLRGGALPGAPARGAALAIASAADDEVDARAAGLGGRSLVGRARSPAGSPFVPAGWTTLVLEPVDAALAPVTHMGRIFLGLLGSVLLLTTAAGTWIGARISRPVVALTRRARQFRAGEATRPAGPGPRAGIAELDVLSAAFDEMIGSLEQSRRELVRASKMAMLGELGAVLAHEVRTPLGIIRSSAQVMGRHAGIGEEGRELMSFIATETDRLNGLVATMLDTARPRQPAFARCDLHALLRRCVQMHELRRGPEAAAAPVELRLEAADPVAWLDEEQFTGAVFNLLNNARQAAGPAGRVAVVTADAPGGALRLCCDDDGPGIPESIRDRLFDPFVTGREGGIGLGLAVVRQVVAAHGGDIRAGRSAWGGASLELTWPRRPPGLPPEQDTPE